MESGKADLLIDAPEARPALAAAAELGVPIFLHPVNPQGLTQRLERYGRLGTFLARGTINSAALVALLEGGVFEECPKLQVVVTTLTIGGLMVADGFGEGARLRKDTPKEQRRHVYIDTMGFHPALIRACVDLVGSDHVIVGSDWPIVSGDPITQRVTHALTAAGLSAEDRQLIAAGNAKRILHLR